MTTLLESDFDRRTRLANAIKAQPDIAIPRLRYWNYDACPEHSPGPPEVGCIWRACGGDLFAHQRTAVAWLYVRKKGILGDHTGLGKTNCIFALVAMLKERGELPRGALVIANTPVTFEWYEKAQRWTRGLSVAAVDGSVKPEERQRIYAQQNDLLIVGYHTAVKDQEFLASLGPYDLVVSDDVDPLLSNTNATHNAIVRIADGATRSFTVNATIIQTRMDQLHSALAPAGGYDLFGPLQNFKSRYEQSEMVTVIEDDGTRKRAKQITGYRRMEELREKFSSVSLRRRASEVVDVRMPTLMPPQTVWLEMSALQRARYTELQDGVVRLLKDGTEKIKHTTALTAFTYGQQICAGLPALNEPDGIGASPKLDWVFARLASEWEEDQRKVILFVKNVGMARAALMRAVEAGIDPAVVWGAKQNKQQRREQIAKFWDNPDCRLIVGTTAIEKSLDLQCANTVVALDTQLNWARMQQLLGRAKRAGSAHDHVFMFNLFMRNTQEERYLKVLSRRQALHDAVYDEEGEIYEQLSAMELLQLIRPN